MFAAMLDDYIEKQSDNIHSRIKANTAMAKAFIITLNGLFTPFMKLYLLLKLFPREVSSNQKC